MRLGFATLSIFTLACSADGGGAPPVGSAGSTSGGSGGSVAGAAGQSGTGGTGATGGSGGVAGAGGSLGGSGGASGSGGTGAICGQPNDCAGAFDLGSLSGDEGGSVTHQAEGSKFLKLRVTEDNHNVIGESLELKLSLQAPPGADVDVYAYLDPDVDQSPCGSQPFAKADTGGIGQNEVVTLAWGDGLTGSGNDDSRNVIIELRHKAGECGAWTLIALGNP